jgi:GcrA cell cycle regulator
MTGSASKFAPWADQFIRSHYKQDMSASEIGKALGVSRGAVVGRARRLGLARPDDGPSNLRGRAYPSKGRRALEPKRPEPAKVRLRAIETEIREATGLAMSGQWRPRTCQFIAGEPSADDACKCGEPVLEGSSYCAKHHAVSWRGSWQGRAA